MTITDLIENNFQNNIHNNISHLTSSSRTRKIIIAQIIPIIDQIMSIVMYLSQIKLQMQIGLNSNKKKYQISSEKQKVKLSIFM